jgi:hypothetical protein
MTEKSSSAPAFGNCTFCGHTFYGRPNQCRQCGQLLHEAAEDAERVIKEGRLAIGAQKARSDTMFLVGLLLGGPMMAIGGNVRAGLLVVFGAGLASVIRRYSAWSTTGTVIAGIAFAGILGVWFIDAAPSEEEVLAAEAARVAFVDALTNVDADVYVETRGAGNFAVWFTVPADIAGECGEYPSEEIRTHLSDLGVRRVVISAANRSGGVCSFAP